MQVQFFTRGVVVERQLCKLLRADITLHANFFRERDLPRAVVFETRLGRITLNHERLVRESAGGVKKNTEMRRTKRPPC